MGTRTSTYERQQTASGAGGGVTLARRSYAIDDATVVQNTVGATISSGVITMPGGSASVEPDGANSLILEWPIVRTDGGALSDLNFKHAPRGDFTLYLDENTAIPDDTDLSAVIYLQGNGTTDYGQAGHGIGLTYGIGSSLDPTRWTRGSSSDAWSQNTASSVGLAKNDNDHILVMSFGGGYNPSNRGARLGFSMYRYIVSAGGPSSSVSSNSYRSWTGHLHDDAGTQAHPTLRLAVFRRDGAAGSLDLAPIISGVYDEFIDVL